MITVVANVVYRECMDSGIRYGLRLNIELQGISRIQGILELKVHRVPGIQECTLGAGIVDMCQLPSTPGCPRGFPIPARVDDGQ